MMDKEQTLLTLIGFLDVVSQMRSAQKEYFRTRNNSALINSKNLEKQIDSFISNFNINETYEQNTQGKA